MWRRKKLLRLNKELTSMAALDRLYDSRTDHTAGDHRAYIARQIRRWEILAEIASLGAKAQILGLGKLLYRIRHRIRPLRCSKHLRFS
jgi:hypothetical protein